MTEVYNVQPDEVNIRVTKGDVFDISFSVKDANGVVYSLVDKKLDMQVKKFDGTTVKTLSSVGLLPAITISEDTFNLKTTAFSEADTFKYDIQVTYGTDLFTIQKGLIIVEEEITTQ